MFKLFNSTKPAGHQLTLQLSGLHCTSCSLNIDGELEDLPGVLSAHTSYAKQECVIVYDPTLIQPDQFTQVITSLGYQVVSLQ